MSAIPARVAAYHILEGFRRGDLDRVGPAVDAAAVADERERGFCRELVLGVLRHDRLYAALADGLLRPGGGRPEPLLLALDLAAHQILGLDRVPDHAVGASTGELLRTVGAPHLVGVANAVVRKLIGLRRTGTGEPWERVAPDRLPRSPAVRFSLPDALVADLAPMVAAERLDLAALNRLPALGTRIRPGCAVADHPAQLRREADFVWWSDPVVALRGPVAAGAAVVQDHSQYAVLRLAGPSAGERALDLCAAPGGKTRHLCDLGCRVIAADVDPDKAADLRRSVECPVLVQDGRRPGLLPVFDLVVVDAPCSNSGVLARRPEAKQRYETAALASLQALQDALLAAATELVAPGGRLLYTTCSVTPGENRERTRSLPGWRVEAEHAGWPDRWQAGAYGALLRRSP